MAESIVAMKQRPAGTLLTNFSRFEPDVYLLLAISTDDVGDSRIDQVLTNCGEVIPRWTFSLLNIARIDEYDRG